MIRQALAPMLLALAACAMPSGTLAQPTATPGQLKDRVLAFVQPTQDGRLAALKTQLDAAGLAYTIEEFAGKRPAPAKGYNVTVRVGPTTGREILLVAHYDAVVLPDGKLVDGVIDNAASVVAMIETTKRLAGRTKHPIRLLITDQEELGLLGAKAFIAAHGIADIAAVINADVSGYGDTLMYGLNNGKQSAAITATVQALCVERAMSCLDFPNYPPSDDMAFTAAGVPTVSLGFLPRDEADNLKLFMNPPPNVRVAAPKILTLIHSPNDRITQVEPATLALAADVFAALAMKLDAALP